MGPNRSRVSNGGSNSLAARRQSGPTLPKPLRQSAEELAWRYSRFAVARPLRLDYRRLRQRLLKRSNSPLKAPERVGKMVVASNLPGGVGAHSKRLTAGESLERIRPNRDLSTPRANNRMKDSAGL
jgi:hypothetical protein